MRQVRTMFIFGALAVAYGAAAARADQFDIQKYFEQRAKGAAVEQRKGPAADGAPPAAPLSGGASDISTATYGIWIVAGFAVVAVASGIILWIRTSALHFAPRVDDAIDREFREMIRETGEEPDEHEEGLAPRRRAAVTEADVIEDLTTDRDERPADAGPGKDT